MCSQLFTAPMCFIILLIIILALKSSYVTMLSDHKNVEEAWGWYYYNCWLLASLQLNNLIRWGNLKSLLDEKPGLDVSQPGIEPLGHQASLLQIPPPSCTRLQYPLVPLPIRLVEACFQNPVVWQSCPIQDHLPFAMNCGVDTFLNSTSEEKK